jgi:hypothetical protein
MLALCRPLPSPPPPPPFVVAVAVDEELQEQLLVGEGELMQREGALAAEEEKANISMKALVKVNADPDA